MARILLLHASVGMGHQRAALALASAFKQVPGISTLVEDTLHYARPLLRRSYAGLYLGIVDKAPGIWSFLYTQTNHPTPIRLVARALSASMAINALPALLDHVRPDAIVCTHFLPLEALAQSCRPILPPIYGVLTDYHAHQFWACRGVERYFVPTPETQTQIVAAGAPSARVQVTGIPITLSLDASCDRAAARRTLGLPAERAVITVIGSGMSAERVRAIVLALLARRLPATLVVATGRNHDLAAQLADVERAAGAAIRVLGLQPSLDPLIVASDLVVGKAGGMTVSEVLARGVPLIIPLPMAGQERWNAAYVISIGAGLSCETAPGIAQEVAALLAAPERLTAMGVAARNAGRPAAAATIAARVLADLDRRCAPGLRHMPAAFSPIKPGA